MFARLPNSLFIRSPSSFHNIIIISQKLEDKRIRGKFAKICSDGKGY